MAGLNARRLWAKLVCFVRRGAAEREMNREIEAHLVLLAEDFERRGMTAAEARLAARRAYGGVEQVKELHRDERSFVWLEQCFQDVKHTLRSLGKSRGFAAVTIVSLALGIGVNAAIFTLVNGVLLKELPVAEPHRVVQVRAAIGKDFLGTGFSYPAYQEITRRAELLESTIGFSSMTGILDTAGGPAKIDVELVTGGYFPFFGEPAAMGRLLDSEDDRVEGARQVCVLSGHAWRAYFGEDAGIVGRRIRVNGLSLEVVGVAPRDFAGAELQKRYDIWTPTALESSLRHNRRDAPNYVWLTMLARMKRGVSTAAADAQLRAASPGVEAALPKDRANEDATYVLRDVSKGIDSWRTRLGEPLTILMAAASLVLLVACANLANLLLARSNERQQEYAVKLALGISRGRLLRQLLIETVLLALAGGLAAVALALPLSGFLQDLFNAGNQSEPLHVTPDARVLSFGLGVSLATALIAGMYPAWRASHRDAGSGLKRVAADNIHRGVVRRGLILVQVALAVVLVFGASLFGRSLRALKTIPLGYNIDHLLTVGIANRGSGNATGAKTSSNQVTSVSGVDEASGTHLDLPAQPRLTLLLERVAAIHGVSPSALAEPAALSGGEMMLDIAATDSTGHKRRVTADLQAITPGYLHTMRLPLLRGRDFTGADSGQTEGVAIVNQHLAHDLWPGEDPVGKHFNGWTGQDAVIVGVVGDSKYSDVRERARGIAYQPFAQSGQTDGAVLIRCRSGCSGIERDVRKLVRTAFPDFQVSDASTMEQMRDHRIARDRLFAFLSSLFGFLGAGLVLVGIYGLISYSVTRRTHEIGIRLSIGAQQRDVLGLFLREAAVLVGLGIAAGIPLGILLARFVGKLLYQVRTDDPYGIAITLGLMAAAGLAAALVPAWRAARVDPVRAMRYE